MDTKKLMQTSDSVGLLVLRLVTGAIFIAHGLPKFGWDGGEGNLASLTSSMESMGIPLPFISGILIGTTEIFGGALLMAGFMTRIVTAAQTFGMLVAVFVVHFSNGFAGRGGYQWALMLAAAAFCLMMEGGGKYSLDRKLSS
ncbi:MAG: putative oxidoreductase [Rhodothermales bacterium]|jgi:putative oxidoreductase